MIDEQKPAEEPTSPIQSLGGDALGATLVLMSQGDRFDASTGIVTGTSKYILMIPRARRMIGIRIRIIADNKHRTRWDVSFSDVEQSSERVMQWLYREE